MLAGCQSDASDDYFTSPPGISSPADISTGKNSPETSSPGPSSPSIGRPIETATEIAVGVNEFPLRHLSIDSPTVVDRTGKVEITGSLNVMRHSNYPQTFDPNTLFFELIGLESGAVLPSFTVLTSLQPAPTLAGVNFLMEVNQGAIEVFSEAHPYESELTLTVHLGSESASVPVQLPELN